MQNIEFSDHAIYRFFQRVRIKDYNDLASKFQACGVEFNEYNLSIYVRLSSHLFEILERVLEIALKTEIYPSSKKKLSFLLINVDQPSKYYAYSTHVQTFAFVIAGGKVVTVLDNIKGKFTAEKI